MAEKKEGKRLSPEEFVTKWQGCKSLEEAREKLGEHASSRATRYRAQGVDLQKFSGGRDPIDFTALAKVAKAAARKE
jgi:hypothetical protein